jgi:hypothetical protein
VSYDTILGMENEFLKCDERVRMIPFSPTIHYANKVLVRLVHRRITDYKIRKFEGRRFFYAAMGG